MTGAADLLVRGGVVVTPGGRVRADIACRAGRIVALGDLAGSWSAETVVDAAGLHFFEVLGSLRWGIACAGMVETFRSGADASVERAMIARRASETEIDLLTLLLPRS